MVWVTAKSSFDHNGAKRRGDEFEVSDQAAEQLKRRRLVTIGGEGPKSSDGQPSSALPAVPASAPTTLPPSDNGEILPPALPPVQGATMQTPPPLPPVVPAKANKPKPAAKPKPKA